MSFPQTTGESRLLREIGSQSMAAEHTVPPLIIKTIDVMRDGFIKPDRSPMAVQLTFAPALAATNAYTAVLELPDENVSMKLHALTMAVVDGTIFPAPGPDIDDFALFVAPNIRTPANVARVNVIRPPLVDAQLATNGKLVPVSAAGVPAVAPWDASAFKAEILHSYATPTLEVVRFAQPIVINGVRGPSGSRAGLRFFFDRVDLLNDVNALVIYLDVSWAPGGVDPR